LAHSFNSLGMVCGVHFGARLILASEGLQPGAAQIEGVAAVNHAFLIIAMLLVLLALLVVLVRRKIVIIPVPDERQAKLLDAIRSRQALLGAGGIALYVGAEVTIGSMLILHLASVRTLNLTLADAGAFVANFYWGGALVGRFAGSWALRHISAPRLLMIAAGMAVLLCGSALALPGPIGAWCLLAVGLFNSVMFPAIFSITLERSSASASATSGLLCVAIGAGAALPLLAGQIADHFGLHWSFAVALAAYAYILLFAATGRQRTLGGRRIAVTDPRNGFPPSA
jgi:FHS family L-fucose permease-like MFS transporter